MSTYDNAFFRYDLDAYGITIKEGDFKQSNIFANRIMSNAFLFDNSVFGILGYVLKEIANDGIIVQQTKDPKLLLEYSEKSLKVLGIIIKMLDSNSIDLKKIWSHYSAHQDSTKLLFMSSPESKAYLKPDKSFSHAAITKLMKILEDNTELLAYRFNEIFKGILNEVGRLSKTNGLYDYDEHFTSLLTMIQKLDDYVKNTSVGGEDFAIRSKKEIIPLAKKILSIYSFLSPDNKQEPEIDELLWILIKFWRLYFIKFMEPSQISYSLKEEQIPDTPEKSQLVNEITSYIEKEIGL